VSRRCARTKKARQSRDHRAFETLHAVELDHAKHDRPDKGKGEIRRQHAQPVDESHGNAPLVYVTARTNPKPSSRFRWQKVSAAVVPAGSIPAAWLKTREINALTCP